MAKVKSFKDYLKIQVEHLSDRIDELRVERNKIRDLEEDQLFRHALSSEILRLMHSRKTLKQIVADYTKWEKKRNEKPGKKV